MKTVGDRRVAYLAFVTKHGVQLVGVETGGDNIPLVDFDDTEQSKPNFDNFYLERLSISFTSDLFLIVCKFVPFKYNPGNRAN
ncbi:hypothetical protein P5673_026370 [Acropora cervicornis]|uniref:Uncharacterized protein n=1 Tax=Acropora cervicornis TaxID=6130 RepID=A0AAD9Q0M6_ACRCE|nr:hypothetical protein P5673_026370 [Acropora cervicornis]